MNNSEGTIVSYLLNPNQTYSITILSIYLQPLLFQKSFAPTIPTSRRIKKESEHLESPAVSRKKGREDKRSKRDKRKGKEIITSASVFSMGPADRGHGRSRGELTSLVDETSVLFFLYSTIQFKRLSILKPCLILKSH